MYESYWNLRRSPFENSNDVDFFFESDTHRTTLVKLLYLIEHRKGAGLLVGGSGSGKSYLLSVLTAQLPESFGPVVPILFPQMSAAELLGYIALQLGSGELGPSVNSLDRVVHYLDELLGHFRQQGRHPILVLEDAHLIEDLQVFQTLRLLMNFHPKHDGSFTLILSGQRELMSRLRRFPQLEERLAVKSLLRALNYEETLGYVAHRLEVAGCQKSMFEPSAQDAIFELSNGIPRRINRLCDLTLLVGYADGTSSISASQVESVSEELTAVVAD